MTQGIGRTMEPDILFTHGGPSPQGPSTFFIHSIWDFEGRNFCSLKSLYTIMAILHAG